MDPEQHEIDLLERKIDRLKREYDLFLAGRRRGEPSTLRDEVARDVLRLTRYPFPSTASRFRMKTLAHRFQAVESQIRQLVELREGRKRGSVAEQTSGAASSILLDRLAVEQPERADLHLRRLHAAVVAALEGRPAPEWEGMKRRLIDEAKRLIERPGVRGVRFSLVQGERGPKIRGEVVTD